MALAFVVNVLITSVFLALRGGAGWHACCNSGHASSARQRGGITRAPARIRGGTSGVTLLLIGRGRERALVIAGNGVRVFRQRRPLRLPGIAILSAILTSCAVGPNFAPPPPPDVTGYLPRHAAGLSPGQRASGQRAVPGGDMPERWWELFRSPHLNELVTQGIIHNPDLQAAEAAVRVAQANALALRGTLFPVVTGDFNASREKQALATVTPTAANNASTFN